MEHHITIPFTKEQAEKLRAGDTVWISGVIYTARDAAHKKMVTNFETGEAFPMELADQIIYYAGPTPKRDGYPIGSCGPTTSGRMDKYAPLLIENGLRGMIGKGERSREVVDAMIKNKAVYFGAIGGAGALLADSVLSCEELAYPELRVESVKRLEVKNFPAIVVIDTQGNNLYERNAN